jgi:hypothetical protein
MYVVNPPLQINAATGPFGVLPVFKKKKKTTGGRSTIHQSSAVLRGPPVCASVSPTALPITPDEHESYVYTIDLVTK